MLTRQIADRHGRQIMPQVAKWVVEGSRVMTDDARVYQHLNHEGYIHESVNHSEKEYVRGEAHTNTIELFWSMLKRGINGTYIHVSKKHLQKYLWEFEYRHNLRHSPHLMFEILLVAFQKPLQLPALPAPVPSSAKAG